MGRIRAAISIVGMSRREFVSCVAGVADDSFRATGDTPLYRALGRRSPENKPSQQQLPGLSLFSFLFGRAWRWCVSGVLRHRQWLDFDRSPKGK